jgi:hypothetical protein
MDSMRQNKDYFFVLVILVLCCYTPVISGAAVQYQKKSEFIQKWNILNVCPYYTIKISTYLDLTSHENFKNKTCKNIKEKFEMKKILYEENKKNFTKKRMENCFVYLPSKFGTKTFLSSIQSIIIFSTNPNQKIIFILYKNNLLTFEIEKFNKKENIYEVKKINLEKDVFKCFCDHVHHLPYDQYFRHVITKYPTIRFDDVQGIIPWLFGNNIYLWFFTKTNLQIMIPIHVPKFALALGKFTIFYPCEFQSYWKVHQIGVSADGLSVYKFYKEAKILFISRNGLWEKKSHVLELIGGINYEKNPHVKNEDGTISKLRE